MMFLIILWPRKRVIIDNNMMKFVPADSVNSISNYILNNSDNLVQKANIAAYNNHDYKQALNYIEQIHNVKTSGEAALIDNILNYIDDNGVYFG